MMLFHFKNFMTVRFKNGFEGYLSPLRSFFTEVGDVINKLSYVCLNVCTSATKHSQTHHLRSQLFQKCRVKGKDLRSIGSSFLFECSILLQVSQNDFDRV